MVAYVKRNLSTLNFFTHRQDDLVKIKVTGMESKELGDTDLSKTNSDFSYCYERLNIHVKH